MSSLQQSFNKVMQTLKKEIDNKNITQEKKNKLIEQKQKHAEIFNKIKKEKFGI